MKASDIALLVDRDLLVPLGGLFACVDSALARVSVARVEELVREDRRGAKTLSGYRADRARYTNLLLLLRMTCELTRHGAGHARRAVGSSAATGRSCCSRSWSWSSSPTCWSASARARWVASTRTGSRCRSPAPCASSAGCSARWPRC